MLVEIDPEAAAPNGPMAVAVSASDEVRELTRDIGMERLRRLVRAIAADLAGADDRPRAIELVGAINRLIEAAGFALEGEATNAPSPAATQAKPRGRSAAAS
jgi:hypothetical protein